MPTRETYATSAHLNGSILIGAKVFLHDIGGPQRPDVVAWAKENQLDIEVVDHGRQYQLTSLRNKSPQELEEIARRAADAALEAIKEKRRQDQQFWQNNFYGPLTFQGVVFAHNTALREWFAEHMPDLENDSFTKKLEWLLGSANDHLALLLENNHHYFFAVWSSKHMDLVDKRLNSRHCCALYTCELIDLFGCRADGPVFRDLLNTWCAVRQTRYREVQANGNDVTVFFRGDHFICRELAPAAPKNVGDFADFLTSIPDDPE